MSDLSFIEKVKLEKLFDMGGGYVLNFSNRTFAEFVAESTGKNIYDSKYDYASGSKANRLRAFWTEEPNHAVGKLISDLLEYTRQLPAYGDQGTLYEDCIRIADRLKQGSPVQDLDVITPDLPERDFEILVKSMKEAIDKNAPESALDRLHTFVIKYMRVLCEKYGITVERDKPLHSLMGEYVKCLKRRGLIESQMTERILKSSVSVMEAFNEVRNEQSLAHDNPVLNYSESLLIFNHVVSTIRFVVALEGTASRSK